MPNFNEPGIIQNLNEVRFADERSMTMLLELPAALWSSQQEGLASFGEPPDNVGCWTWQGAFKRERKQDNSNPFEGPQPSSLREQLSCWARYMTQHRSHEIVWYILCRPGTWGSLTQKTLDATKGWWKRMKKKSRAFLCINCTFGPWHRMKCPMESNGLQRWGSGNTTLRYLEQLSTPALNYTSQHRKHRHVRKQSKTSGYL